MITEADAPARTTPVCDPLRFSPVSTAPRLAARGVPVNPLAASRTESQRLLEASRLSACAPSPTGASWFSKPS